MEAPQGRGGITPLPPPGHDGSGRDTARAPRPWLPALLALGGLFVFAMWLSESGPDPDAAASAPNSASATLAPLSARDIPTTTLPPSPSTTTRPPPRLDEVLPWVTGSLVMFSQTDDGASMLHWIGRVRSPEEYRLSGSNVIDIRPEPQSLDHIAYETAGTVRALYVGGWQDQEPVFVGSQGFAWDPEGSATVAWVGTDQVTQTTSLYTKAVGDPIVRVADLPNSSFLMEWTDSGLVMTETMGPPVNLLDQVTSELRIVSPTMTVLRDIDGTATARAAARPIKVSRNGTIVATGTAVAFDALNIEITTDLEVPDQLVVIDSSPPEAGPAELSVRHIPIRETLADGESMFSADERWSLSPSGRWAGRIVNWTTSTSLVVQSLETLSVRVVPIRTEVPLTTVGFSSDGLRFFAFSSESDELVAIDWSSGAQFVVQVEGNITLGGAYVRR